MNHAHVICAALSEDGGASSGNEHAHVLAAVLLQGRLALELASEEFRRDHRIVLAAVSRDWHALECAAPERRKDRDIVLAAVTQDGLALQHAAAELKNDREVVLAAVTTNGHALEHASKELRRERKIVLAAVLQRGGALRFAAEEFKSDRDVVLAAISQNEGALEFAADTLLEDVAFAEAARQGFYFFKITALSGRSCYVALSLIVVRLCNSRLFWRADPLQILLKAARNKLGIADSGRSILLHGSETVLAESCVGTWPGSPVPGLAVDYTLVMSDVQE
mmetsp:Transcript_48345/g.108573  ORF Transcript_48345/g.108573 Transcript_48345/m.108573 type:complete len:279 (+) Transcript_48345:112-948(+)